jgi:hypothetical protein
MPRLQIPFGPPVFIAFAAAALVACAQQPPHRGPALSVSQVHLFCDSLTEGQSLAALQFPFGAVQALPESGQVVILPEPRRANCACVLVIQSGVLISRENRCPN